jgi:hypothetical protein
MTTTEYIDHDLGPKPAGTPAAAPSVPPPRSRQGHRPKIRAAFDALERDGLLPPHLRPCARFRVAIDWLMAAGYANDLPERDAIEREYKRWLRERSSAQGAKHAPLAPHAA